MTHALHRHELVLTALACLAAIPSNLAAQDSADSVLLALNRQLLEQQVVQNSATLLQETALEQFLVVAPGGIVETKAQAVRGVASFDATGIEVSQERVARTGATAVVVGRLVIDGEMRPLGRIGPMRFMAVFVQQDGSWRLLGRSLTPCHPMAVARGLC